MRDLHPRLAVAVVLLVGTALVGATIGFVVHLQRDAAASRDAQSRLLSLRLDSMQLRDVPWDAAPGSGTTPAEVRGELHDSIGGLRSQLTGLERHPGLPDGTVILSRFDAESAALWQLYRAVRANDSKATDAASNSVAVKAYAADDVMKKAAAVYGVRSEQSRERATVGSAVAIAVLFCAFALFYVRAAIRRRRSEQLVAALRETEAQRARLFASVVNAAEEERTRIAADLHDGPIQQMSTLVLTLDLAAARAGRGDTASLPASLDDARRLASEQIGALRTMMAGLRPSALAEAGIEAALEDLVATFERRSGVGAALESSIGGRRFDGALETTVYRVAQEALANVEKHAGATRVTVTLSERGGLLQLRVEDDGVGFEPRPEPELLRDSHFGLVGARERVEQSGGTWRLRSEAGRGTVVAAAVPVTAAA